MGKAVAALSKVTTHFRVAFAYRMPIIATHLTVRLVTAALFVPMIGLLLGSVVGFSGRSATIDQDIARLLLTPAGAFAVLAALTLGIAAAVLDVTLMMYILAIREPRSSLRSVGGLPSSSRFFHAWYTSASGFSCAFSASPCPSFWRWLPLRIGFCATTTSTTTSPIIHHRPCSPPPSSQPWRRSWA